jgi:hypothetical protein
MLEVAFVLAVVAALGLLGLPTVVFSLQFPTVIGLATLLLGLVVGVPTGFWYHVVLYRIASAKTPLPRRWWLSPSDLHACLTDVEQRRIRPWYRIGGAGFVLCVVGAVLAIVSLVGGRW